MMPQHHDRLEPLPDGFVGFRAANGGRWKHRDVEAGRTGPGYRLFVSESGEQRRYVFGPSEPHDATLLDLREQLARARLADAADVSEPAV
jgi:hypothetical protein